LAITRRLVNLMGGEVGVESESGRGSTFWFTARLVVANTQLDEASPVSMGDLARLPVLVVDDNATNRRILEETLRHWGMIVKGADSGADGLNQLEDAFQQGRPFRLIILDERMPGMDGIEVLERIRANPRLRGATIMLLTSDDQSSSAARCKRMGAEAYLIKPIKPAELQMTIRKLLGRSEWAAAAASPAPAEAELVSESIRKLSILIAEDNAVNQKLAVAMVERLGHRATLASNGNEAVEKWKAGKFDLVLMDVQMPEADGFEATRRIRSMENDTRTPIIAMTAHAMTGDRDRCLEAGMDDYVSKPVRKEALHAAIARIG